MPVPATAWPTLSGGAGRTAPADTTARLLNANHDIKQLLSYIDKQAGHRVPTQIEELTGDLLKNPLGADWPSPGNAGDEKRPYCSESSGRTASANSDEHRQLGRHRESGASPSVPSVVSWLCIVCDRGVRLNDPEAVNRYRRETPVEMTAKANRLRERAAKTIGSAPLASVRFLAARQLRSGDLRFTARTAKEAEILRAGALSREESRGAASNLGYRDPRYQCSLAGGEHATDRGSTGRIGERQRSLDCRGKSGSLVAEFTSPLPANTAIDRGVFWDGSCLTAVIYNRAICVHQCHNYQKYGHIGATCPNMSPTCVYYAGGHLSQNVLTVGAHTPANDCPDRLREVDKMKEMAGYRPRYHLVPAHFSANTPSMVLQPSPASLWGTPVEQSSSSEGSGTRGSDLTTAGSESESAAQTQDSTSPQAIQSSLQAIQRARTKGKETERRTTTQSGAKVSRSGLQRQQQLSASESIDVDMITEVVCPVEDTT
ncbi:hypothetical protein N7495_009707 [Penicillium taxi]|uniref:uncharacterized protein n=1 Tax=Penicillium taxi TaxID=168475 RepID=UPI002545473B|nr:uncharacterized protein N7495_009707 [Penicillium taxi]KAJ5885197.1 hypothetical protein N7495_009707 [Penicillium taxi]